MDGLVVRQHNSYGINLIKALAHPIRLKVITLLQHKEMSISEINAEIGTSNPNLSKHLNILRHSCLVKNKKNGKKTICFLSDSFTSVVIKDILRILNQS